MKSTFENLANLEKGELQPNGYLLVRANTSSKFNVESCANQVSSTFFGGFVPGSERQSGKDRLCFFGECEDCFQLQALAKIPAFFSISQVEIARLVLRLLKIEGLHMIAIDRTEWQLGTQWVNVLMLSIAYRSVSIPLFWTVLGEKGCSDDAERRAILQKFIDEFGTESIRFVTADREFCSKEWLKFLIENKISYRLRIKASHQITNVRGVVVRASRLCRTLKINQREELRGKRLLWGQAVFVAVCRKQDGDNVLVISSEQSGRILLEYGERWKIETLFGILKTRGFRLEDTHLTEVERISKLLSLLTIAVSWAMLTGEVEVKTTPLKTKKHGRLEKSLFRFGFETLRSCFCQLTTNFRQKQRFQQLTLLLSCT